MSGPRQILKNASALLLARGATMGLNFAAGVYLARTLEPGRFGILGFGAALLSYYLLLSQLGLNLLGTREVARDRGRARSLVAEVLGLKLVLASSAALLYVATVLLLPKPPLFKGVLLVQGLALIGHALSLEWFFQGVEKMGLLALRNVAVAVLNLAGLLALVAAPDDVLAAAGVTAGALLVGNAWLMVTYHRSFGLPPPRFSPAAWRRLLAPALPIAFSLFMIEVYYSLDKVMIGLIHTSDDVGLYEAAYRLLATGLVLATILHQAFFPALSSAFGDAALMRVQARRFARAMLGIGLPIGAAGVLLATPAMALVYGSEYTAASAALAILMGNAVLVYVNMTYGQPLLAWDAQRSYMWAVAAGGAANIVLNVALIPEYRLEGAATATLLSEGVVLVGLLALHRRIAGELYGGTFARSLAATALGVVPLAAWWSHAGWPLLAALPALALSYGLAALAVGLVPPEVVGRTLAAARSRLPV